MKVTEVKEHSTEELEALLHDNRRKLFDLRAQAVTEKIEDSTAARKIRKDIARIMTVLRTRNVAHVETQIRQRAKAKK
ncbi:MAG: 50S ribosomal protein L29 [Phycisphaerae bacterium]|nr:50S ribosomal protein L29 [Phycisphaerae bacterium]